MSSEKATNSKMDMTMQMNFYRGQDAIILFPEWPGHSLGMYLVALLFVFLLAVAVEFLSTLPPVKPGSNHVIGALRHSVVYSLRMGLAYLVMLSVMSFNLGVFVAAVVGHGVGFFMAKITAIGAAKRAASLNSPSSTVSV